MVLHIVRLRSLFFSGFFLALINGQDAAGAKWPPPPRSLGMTTRIAALLLQPVLHSREVGLTREERGGHREIFKFNNARPRSRRERVVLLTSKYNNNIVACFDRAGLSAFSWVSVHPTQPEQYASSAKEEWRSTVRLATARAASCCIQRTK